MVALLEIAPAETGLSPSAQPTVRWLGRRHHWHWSVAGEAAELSLQLVDVWSGGVTEASVRTPGWMLAEDEIVLSDYALARALVEAGVLAVRLSALAVGSRQAIVGRLSARSLRELAAAEAEPLPLTAGLKDLPGPAARI